MKLKTHSIYLGQNLNLNQSIFVIIFLLSPLGANANQCIDLFNSKVSPEVSYSGMPKKIAPLVTAEMNWSNSSELFMYKENNNQTVISVKSGQKIELGNDRVIFSNEGHSASVFSNVLKKLFTYTLPDFKKTEVIIDADHIVDIKNQHVIAQRKNEKGYFIFSSKTGELLHHAALAQSYIRMSDSANVAFATEPAINGFSKQSGVVESISLANLTPELHTGHLVLYDQLDRNFNNDHFIKVKSGNDDVLIRKNDLTEYKIGPDFVRAYDVDTEKNIFVIQTTDSIVVYKNGVVDLRQVATNSRDIKIVGLSETEAVYLAFDAKLGKLFSIMTFWGGSSNIEMGPAADLTFFKPKMVGLATLMYQGIDKRFYRWGLRTNQIENVPENIAKGVSDRPKFVAYYNNKLGKWEFKEIVMAYKK